MPINLISLVKTIYNNVTGTKDTQTPETEFGAWDAEQIVGKVNEIVTELNALDTTTPVQGSQVVIGSGASASATYGVAIGYGATANLSNATAVGMNADCSYDPSFGVVGGNESVALGEEAKSAGWRNTALGAKAHAMGQSSTAIGTGAEALSSHSLSIGRGSVAGSIGSTVVGGVGNNRVYLGTSWGNYFRMPLSGIGIGSRQDLTDVSCSIVGHSAYDARPRLFTDKTTWYKYDEIVYQHQLYICRTTTTSAPTVGVTDANWSLAEIVGVTEYYNTGNITQAQWFTWTGTSWSVVISAPVIHNGVYYLCIDNQNVGTAPDVNPTDYHLMTNYIDVNNDIILGCFDWDRSDVVYNTDDITWSWDCINICLSDGVTSTPPRDNVSNAEWRVIPTSTDRYSLGNTIHLTPACKFHQNAGHLDLVGGKPNGQGYGGDLNLGYFKRSVGAVDNYTSQTQENVIRIDGTTGDIYIIIKDLDSTERKIEVGAVDSGGAGYRALRILN